MKTTAWPRRNVMIVLTGGCLVATLAALVSAEPAAATRATTCFTVTVTNTPLQPPPGVTVCSPVDPPQ